MKRLIKMKLDENINYIVSGLERSGRYYMLGELLSVLTILQDQLIGIIQRDIMNLKEGKSSIN